VEFLWGSATVSPSCGVSVGLAKAPGWLGRPGHGYPNPAGLRTLMPTSPVTQRHRSDPSTCDSSTLSLPVLSPLIAVPMDYAPRTECPVLFTSVILSASARTANELQPSPEMRRDRGRSQSLSVTAMLARLIQAERPAEAGRIASCGPSRGRAQ
jgi:hypothetical protein